MNIDIVPFQAKLERIAFSNNIDVVAFADLEGLESDYKKGFENYSKAIILGQSFSNNLFSRYKEDIFDFHISKISSHLSESAYKIFHLISIEGYDSLILPPLFLDSKDKYVSLNKRIGELAGIGKVGKKGFFVSPSFGVKIVLTSVLTDAPFETDKRFFTELCNVCNICDTYDFEYSVRNCPYGRDKIKIRHDKL